MKKKALILLSGGVDSIVVLWWARRRYRTAALTFHMPESPRGEALAARTVARKAGVTEHLEVPLDFLVNTRGIGPAGYLPKRNLIYYSVAASIAERIGATALVGGHLRTDGETFDDARLSYFRTIQRVAGCRIVLPLIDRTKDEAIRLGRKLGAPIELGWSCYRDGRSQCGECVACRERAVAFRRVEEAR